MWLEPLAPKVSLNLTRLLLSKRSGLLALSVWCSGLEGQWRWVTRGEDTVDARWRISGRQ